MPRWPSTSSHTKAERPLSSTKTRLRRALSPWSSFLLSTTPRYALLHYVHVPSVVLVHVPSYISHDVPLCFHFTHSLFTTVLIITAWRGDISWFWSFTSTRPHVVISFGCGHSHPHHAHPRHRLAQAHHMTSSPDFFGAGVKDTVTTIPAGWSQMFLLSAGEGINAGMLSWGDRMLKFTGKARADKYLDDTHGKIGLPLLPRTEQVGHVRRGPSQGQGIPRLDWYPVWPLAV